jgi:hypothetical protein
MADQIWAGAWFSQDQIGGLLPPSSNYEGPATAQDPTKFTPWSATPHPQDGSLTTTAKQVYGNAGVSQHGHQANSRTTSSQDIYSSNSFAQLPLLHITVDNNAQPMAPPANSRKRKAQALRDEDWEPVKARVIELHITQDRPLHEVKGIIESEFANLGFSAT